MQEIQARDTKGRPRFHGAFTGGFSAGYFNTVGSKEGKIFFLVIIAQPRFEKVGLYWICPVHHSVSLSVIPA